MLCFAAALSHCTTTSLIFIHLPSNMIQSLESLAMLFGSSPTMPLKLPPSSLSRYQWQYVLLKEILLYKINISPGGKNLLYMYISPFCRFFLFCVVFKLQLSSFQSSPILIWKLKNHPYKWHQYVYNNRISLYLPVYIIHRHCWDNEWILVYSTIHIVFVLNWVLDNELDQLKHRNSGIKYFNIYSSAS